MLAGNYLTKRWISAAGRELPFGFPEPQSAIEGIADADGYDDAPLSGAAALLQSKIKTARTLPEMLGLARWLNYCC